MAKLFGYFTGGRLIETLCDRSREKSLIKAILVNHVVVVVLLLVSCDIFLSPDACCDYFCFMTFRRDAPNRNFSFQRLQLSCRAPSTYSASRNLFLLSSVWHIKLHSQTVRTFEQGDTRPFHWPVICSTCTR